MKKWILIGVIACCSIAYAGEIADLHSKLVGADKSDPKKSRSHGEVENTKHGITEIGLERTGCYGPCPAYTVVIKSDGKFRYQGDVHSRITGKRTGQVESWRFNQLAQFIKDADYMEMENNYSRAVTDNPSVYTTVVLNGRRKVINNYANAGPTKLWAIEELIDKLMSEAKWDGEQAEKK